MAKTNDEKYFKLLKHILKSGYEKTDRTGTGTTSIFGYQMKFDLSNMKIPLLTTKEIKTNSLIHEIIWYLSGSQSIKYLNDNNVHIWDSWADEDGNLGPVYGHQWRNWGGYEENIPHELGMIGRTITGIDQIAQIIDLLKNNPDSRRILVSSWNVTDVPKMGLPPCHYSFQLWTRPYDLHKRLNLLDEKMKDVPGELMERGEYTYFTLFDKYKVPRGELKCIMNQRSVDVPIGLPFNIAQYSILTHMLAHVTQWEASEFIWNGGDTHIYSNQIDGVNEQLTRDPKLHQAPTLQLNNDVENIDDFRFEDIQILNYHHDPFIKFPVAV